MSAMKPVAFTYYRPASRDEAIALPVRHSGEAKILAGGQSLLPTMNFRIARPSVQIDVNHVPALGDIRIEGRQLRIGALARHVRFEHPLTDGPLEHCYLASPRASALRQSAVAAPSAAV
jgi:carbon-monoxide dehydrogenase medium subunit